jgi:tRNA threonylcarbamoyladenosine biosynthesis protein TsaE
VREAEATNRPQTGAGEALTLDALRARATALWRELPPGAVVWLTGDLGAGKTTFVQALADAARAEAARSPTFALVHEYQSPEGLLVHADCYRLRSADEAIDLDFPDLERRARLLVVEWPERAGRHAPSPTAHIHLSFTDRPDERWLTRVR